MEYIDKLIEKTNFLQYIKELELKEKQRIFCGHGLSHLLDVARLAWIRNISEGLGLSQEEIYLAALLHDIGRAKEYESGRPHEIAGAEIAGELLDQIGCPHELKKSVLEAAGKHRGEKNEKSGKSEKIDLTELLRWADKRSRNCFFCEAQKECRWPGEKRNRTIEW